MINLPNLLTLSRIAAIPILVALLYFHDPVTRWIALVLFVIAAVTDYLDGYLARHRGEVSAFGRFLDPIADKLLVASLIVVLVAIDQISGMVVIPAIVILCREILVSGLREYLAEVQVPLPVSRLAKWKTARGAISARGARATVAGGVGTATGSAQHCGAGRGRPRRWRRGATWTRGPRRSRRRGRRCRPTRGRSRW